MSSPTLLASLLAGRTSRTEEQQVLALLRMASASALDRILLETDAAELIGSLDDRRFGPANRTAVRDLLVARIGDLSIQARANLAYGLQAGPTSRADAEAIRAVFLSCRGEDLTRLKNAMNMRTDSHDLEGLVYSDVGSPTIRAEILNHIAREAAGVEPGEAKVLCDIDDTVVCALHDRRYPRGTIYPGILALLDALDRGPDDEPFSMGDLTFVTARPGDAFGLIENHTRASLRRAGIAHHSVMTGTVQALFTCDLMAGRKIANIEHYHALFPEYRLLFIGDSGQADIRVGDTLWQRLEHALDIVFIHDVVHTSDAERARLRGERIHLVDTYVGAARIAHERGLIARAGLDRVVQESLSALAEIRWSSVEQERATRALFERDAALG
ncbi:hypothetical protein PCC79_05145 [Propioniciclava soli]|uniref:Phosphatidate phosphatase APP1 catalytic domain-containing protein n=1 Tax=Propioniciclava soli TaxID=2775081 RepID=A0ABZ3CBL7_9ACTN